MTKLVFTAEMFDGLFFKGTLIDEKAAELAQRAYDAYLAENHFYLLRDVGRRKMKRISDSDLLSYHRGDMDQGTTRQIMASELILARRVIEEVRHIDEYFILEDVLKAYDEGVK